ncbi:MAG: formamidopyrimidine-DNA glycosylase [Gammaproteobacteria bacterium]|nr:formamidopyrimidine-DNA glycosylase [Gammaproteobacteria bacterium]|tara:strand:- start:24 stop:833 length:810 start_codon:yes stop_codon:yes gene_type:complete
MPELPEVETIKNALEKVLNKQVITDFEIYNSKLRWKIQKNIKKYLKKNIVRKISRRGKYICISFKNGSLIIHLGMTGVFKILSRDNNLIEKHDHYQITIKKYRIIFNDIRKFGSLHWTNILNEHPLIKNLGVEPLDKDLTEKYIFQKSRKRKLSIKNFIMDQKIVVGVGNIYASEALFLSKINPNKKSYKLKKSECKNLVLSIKKVLIKSVKAGGTTLRNYKQIDGTPGYFKQKLLVYGKEFCPICKKSKITKTKIGGRMSYYCRKCQK